MTIVDERRRRRRTESLTGWMAAAHDACERARTAAELEQPPS